MDSLFYLQIIALMITRLMYSLLIGMRSYILCVIGETIKMIMIELRRFSYNFAYTIMSDILTKRIKTKLLFNEKSTNY